MNTSKIDISKGPMYVNAAAKEAADHVMKKTGYLGGMDPMIMIVLGSGCGDIAANIEKGIEIDYADIPHMSPSTVEGHKSSLLVGKYNDVDVLGFQGRNHCYEGYTAHQASFMVYLAKHLGAEVSIMTTATGIAPRFGTEAGEKNRYPAEPGDLLVVKTVYPNMLPSSLRGSITKEVGQRFNGAMDMPTIYLGLLAKAVAAERGVTLGECAYVPRPGPNYETPLEVSLLSQMSSVAGIPVVGGMSVIPELEAANLLRMENLVLAVVTNKMFDMEARQMIENDAIDSLGGMLGQYGAEHTLDEAGEIIGRAIMDNQPTHEEVAETAGRKDVTENLDAIISGVVKAIRF